MLSTCVPSVVHNSKTYIFMDFLIPKPSAHDLSVTIRLKQRFQNCMFIGHVDRILVKYLFYSNMMNKFIEKYLKNNRVKAKFLYLAYRRKSPFNSFEYSMHSIEECLFFRRCDLRRSCLRRSGFIEYYKSILSFEINHFFIRSPVRFEKGSIV